MKCTHHWTVTSECPKCLRELLDRAYTELRKQVFGSRVVFDREICELAEKERPGVQVRSNMKCAHRWTKTSQCPKCLRTLIYRAHKIDRDYYYSNVSISRIRPLLYQGSNPPQGDFLAKQKFRALVLCAREWQDSAEHYPGLEVFHAPLRDDAYIPVQEADRAAEWAADQVGRKRKTLICCNMGMNRSGLVTALTLRKLTRKSGNECLWEVQTKRPGALFNRSFAAYLFRLPAIGEIK